MEQTILYELHLPIASHQENYLIEKLGRYLAFVQVKSHDYIWNNEGFVLNLSPPLSDQPQFLIGNTNYGDNVDDEWFIIYLLYELSRLDKDLVITLEDFDGQVLLIEAANQIPKWLDPSNSENRVFIHQGKVHIIPKTLKLEQGSASRSIAIEYIRKNSNDTQADSPVQNAIDTKLNRFPSHQKSQLHRALCYLPLSIVKLLQSDPKLISSAINAFYERDPYEARSLRYMKRFRSDKRMMKTVTFTRNLYAKIVHNIYLPDKRSGWTLPPKNAPEFKSHDLGLKIACGFEIILSSVKDPEIITSEFENIDYKIDSKWQKYKKNLESYGYFRDELEGSKLHKELLDKAKESYYNSFIKGGCQKSRSSLSTSSARSKIALLADSSDDDREKINEEFPSNDLTDDDDSWLNVTSEQLDSLLEECFSTTKDRKSVRPEDVTKLMRNFIERKGSNSKKIKSVKKTEVKADTAGPSKVHGGNLYGDSFLSMSQLDDDRMLDNTDSSSDLSECGYDDDYDQEDDFEDVDDFEDECSSDTNIDELSEEDQRLDCEIKEMISDLQKLGQDISKGEPIDEKDRSSLKISDYMKLMDKELKSTNVNVKDFLPVDSRVATKADLDSDDDTDEDVEDAKLDAAICHNLLEAYNSGLEASQPGAACNMLQSMRLLPSKAMNEMEKKS